MKIYFFVLGLMITTNVARADEQAAKLERYERIDEKCEDQGIYPWGNIREKRKDEKTIVGHTDVDDEFSNSELCRCAKNMARLTFWKNNPDSKFRIKDQKSCRPSDDGEQMVFRLYVEKKHEVNWGEIMTDALDESLASIERDQQRLNQFNQQLYNPYYQVPTQGVPPYPGYQPIPQMPILLQQ